MNDQPLISCLIIFFNPGEQFFREAIESVFVQTYKYWELLLVDDGSSDGSTEIARNYVEKYPDKVRYLEHEGHQNLGMSATRNLGLRHAKGEYITWLDADDVWLSNALENQLALLSAYPEAAMVYGPIQYWYSWTGNIEDLGRDILDTPKVFLETSERYLHTLIQPPTLFVLLLKRQIGISGMLLRRHVIEQVGVFEPAFQGLYEDQVFCSKVCLHFPVFVTSQWWYKYRQHPQSCVSTGTARQEFMARRMFLNWLKRYLLEQSLQRTEAWQVLEKELWPYNHPFLNHLQKHTQHLIQKGPKRVQLKIKKYYLSWQKYLGYQGSSHE